jgi:biopolymer transport protein ExbD
MTLTLSGSSVVIEGDGIAEPIAAKDMDALAESLVKVSSALSPGGTSVSLLASDTTNYQQVVDVMDRLIEAGFKSISIGSPTEEEGPSSSKDPSKEELAKAAVVTLSKTTVFVDDEPVGEISAGVESWQAAMVAALKAGHPGSSVLIIQADKAVLHKTLVAVIDAARPAGFVDIAFAVDAEE